MKTQTTDITSPIYKNNNKESFSSQNSNPAPAPDWVIWVLAFLVPCVAVGLVTDWDMELTLICLGLMILFWLPGIIMALIVVSNHI